MTPYRIVIVGGGTAGWLSAMMLHYRLKDEAANYRITVVESSTIPTIGVGEGTTAVFKFVLDTLGIDEREFISATGATIKFGIKHRDWKLLGHTYDGPIDDPNQLHNFDRQYPWLDLQAVAAGKSIAQHHLFYYLLNLNKSPIARTRKGKDIAVGPFEYAYHFDQAKVGAFLRQKCADVDRIDATIAAVTRTDTGDIDALICEDGKNIGADFFIDCTGFSRQLIGKSLDVKWVSYNRSLPVNRAMPFWLDHPDDGVVPPYTLAWAQKAGWMWSIPTQDRVGCGYVYCDQFLTPDEAQTEIETVLGKAIEPRRDLPFNSGRLAKSWSHNCLALGLSSSFMEPLEATSIHGTVVQLMLLTQRHIQVEPHVSFIDRDQYNEVVAQQVDDFREFVNLHYVSERRDSQFWQHVSEDCITENNQGRILRWKQHMPMRQEFASLPDDLPHVGEQLYYPVLDGLGLLSSAAAKMTLGSQPHMRTKLRKLHQSMSSDYRKAAAQALDHKQFLTT